MSNDYGHNSVRESKPDHCLRTIRDFPLLTDVNGWTSVAYPLVHTHLSLVIFRSMCVRIRHCVCTVQIKHLVSVKSEGYAALRIADISASGKEILETKDELRHLVVKQCNSQDKPALFSS